MRDPQTLQPVQKKNVGDNFFTHTHHELDSSETSSPNQVKQKQKKTVANKSHYSHARRAADEHSIIFEEDLDSEGELERSTYYRHPIQNFSLKEDKLGSEMEESSANETHKNKYKGPMNYEPGATSQNFNDNSTLSHMHEVNSKDFYN